MPTTDDYAHTAPAEPSPEHPPTVHRSEDYDQIMAAQRQAKVVTAPAQTKPATTRAETKAETPPAGEPGA
jgi:hypothetical protein